MAISSFHRRCGSAAAWLATLCVACALCWTGAARAQSRSVPDTAAPAAASPGEPGRVALVIGNANYRALPKLPNPRNDAQDMCASLRRLGFAVVCAIDVPTRRALRELVREFSRKLQPGSLAMFYFAGHGVQFRGENFLLPADIEARSSADIEDEALSLSYVLRSLEEARSAPNVVVLDACRDNPFSRSAEIGATRGLARTEPPLGTVLVYATAPNAVAIDGNERNGLFTKHLLANLPRPGLKLEELMQVVAKSVEDEARAAYRMEQVPFRSSSFAGSYCLAGCENAQFAEKLDQIAKQSEEAMRRIKLLGDENARLRAEAQERASRIADMETRIARLNDASSRSGTQAKEAEDELRRLHAELDAARQRQLERDRAQQREGEREKELIDLRGRLAVLQRQAGELVDAKEQRRLTEQATASSAAKERELAELKQRLTELQAQAQQVDDYRRQVQRLQQDNEQKARLLGEREDAVKAREPQRPAAPRPTVVVPSF